MRITKKYLHNCIDIAQEAAFSAGKFLSNYKKTDIKIESRYGKDIKISPDRESEEIIIDILRTRSDLAILSEERGYVGEYSEKDSLMWIIDPLDGSFNFFRGIPGNCVSIAVWHKNKPLIGVIYDFSRGELFIGIEKTGSWLNDSKIEVSKVKNKQDAVLFTGFPVNTDFSTHALNTYVKEIQTFKKVRLIGSAALSLAYVAAGRGDIYHEKDIMQWDIAAGLAILSGAGGTYLIKECNKSNAYDVYASNNFLYNTLES